MSFWDMLMGMTGGPATLATTPVQPHPAAPMGGPVQMQGLPTQAPGTTLTQELPVGVPLPPPRPKEQARMGLDTTGLAELSAGASRYWPENAKEISEAWGQMLPPPDAARAGFVSPGFIGPMPPVAQRNTPFRNEIPTRAFGGMMDPNAPVGEDEFRALIQRFFQPAQQGRPGSTWM